jgi:NADH-quinone oxidoreductase subunit M
VGYLGFMILIPLLAALLVAALPPARARMVATLGTLLPCVVCLGAIGAFDWNFGGTFSLLESYPWLPSLGVSLNLGVDAVSLLLIALTVLLGPICVIGSFTAINERVKTYYSWLLVLQAAMTGVFAARDLVFFYICFEFTLIPMWILIHLYGSTNRAKAATKFFLYTFTGSLIALAGLVYVVWSAKARTGVWTFDLEALAVAARNMEPGAQAWVLFALLAGFAVKVPLFPFHTWLPLAHTEAPTAGSVILAGVLLKLGTYGIYRFALGFCPDALAAYAPFLAVVCIIGIVYAGLICWVQEDVKKLVAYSSVSHLGFCILGLVALNPVGLTGSVLYMINHGLSTGALFLMIGMMYERYHTRSMRELGGLAAKMPIWATFMVFFTLASVGLPGLNGFVSEFLCLMGAFQASPRWAGLPGGSGFALGPWYAAIAGTGMIVAAIYLLYMVGRVVWGGLVEPHGHGHGGDHGDHAGGGHGAAAHAPGSLPPDLTGREIGVLLPLAAACLFLGLYPKPVLDSLQPAVTEALRDVQAIGNERALAAPGVQEAAR